jgi:hypothetical protein
MSLERMSGMCDERERALAFHSEFGITCDAFLVTLTGICELSGDVSLRWDDGIVVTVPDLQKNPVDIIRLPSTDRSNFDLVRTSFMQNANMQPNGEEEQVGNYLHRIGVRAKVTVADSTIAMSMRREERAINDQITELLKQFRAKGLFRLPPPENTSQ